MTDIRNLAGIRPATSTARTIEGERVAWVDAAKGMCIILVVMMHSVLGVGDAMGGEGFMHVAVAFAAPFRMPDFFLISGLFLARVIDRDWRSYADKRVVHFLYFYLLWLLIQTVVKAGSFTQDGAGGLVEHLVWALVQPYSTLWFVYMLAIFSVAAKLLRSLPVWALLGFGAVLEIAPINTGAILIDEFAGRFVYFLAGYLLATHIFRLADWALANKGAALAGLGAWALVNGWLALTPSGIEGHEGMLASLPFVSLFAGAIGAVAMILISALLAQTLFGGALSYAGRHAIAVYLAFFLPMAATRIILIRLGIVEDIGLISLIVTIAAVTAPLVLERIVRHTPLNFIFERPAMFRIPPARTQPRPQPAE
ncbi:MAG: acyltransferase [Salinarimonadaceae bacterium]|nr:MAG: acyltransferase [Salinarimonadaceae bacterium]